MSFLYPLGLLGLIGVPIVILIYILKNKYNEQTVPSTYLWTLSERFFKKRNPLSGLAGIISLILQILTIIFVSLAIARPVFVVRESALEYCFVLDCSGSMKMENKGKTRFDLAKKEIGEIIKDAGGGSTYTLVAASAQSGTVYERITDKKLALEMLSEVECSDGMINEGDALLAAQRCFDENPSFVTYLMTDKSYARHDNVEVISFGSQNDINYSVSDVEGTLMGGTLYVNAKVNAYTEGGKIDVALYVNGGDKPVAEAEVEASVGSPASIELSCVSSGYDSFTVKINVEDSLPADNEFTVYNQKSEAAYDILLVSETPFFFEAALDVITDSRVDVVSPKAYKGQSGYGLYIFHSFTPEVLPDAAVWLVNSSESVADSGFGSRGVIELSGPSEIVKTNSTSSIAKGMLEGVEGRNIFISEYVKYSGMYSKFTTLFSYDSNPLIFAGTNALGNRQVVIGFDLHKADFSLSADYIPLMSNLLNYTCPDALDKTGYLCGEEAKINITANVTNVKAISPDGEEIYVDASVDVGILSLDKVGTYTVKMITPDSEREYKLYSGAPTEESVPVSEDVSFSLEGERGFDKSDGEYDPLVILFICLAVLFAADWMVYCYEKYQLR